MKNRIREFRQNASLSMDKLASRVNTTRSTIMKLERGDMKLTTDWMNRIASALDLQPHQLITSDHSPKIPVIGKVGAGAMVFPYDDVPLMPTGLRESDQAYINCDFVDAPPGITPGSVVALRVEGDSMYPALRDGWVVYYSQRTEGGCDTMLGRLCVLKVKDGAVLVKEIKKGHKYGCYTLASYNANSPDMPDQQLEWCARVIFIKPA